LPTLFTLVLTGVLLTLFDYDVKSTVYKFGARIPIIKHIVPDHDNAAEPSGNPASELILGEQRIEELSAMLADKEREIDQLRQQLAQRDGTVAQLEDSVERLLLVQENAQAAVETYRRPLRERADMFSGMTACKAAPILPNLTTPELVLVMYE